MEKNKILKRASRDLFSISLSLDVLMVKIQNIAEDLLDGDLQKEASEALTVCEHVRLVQKILDTTRGGWDNASK